nr:MAG: hypothetical protein [Betatorquevirus sp.]
MDGRDIGRREKDITPPAPTAPTTQPTPPPAIPTTQINDSKYIIYKCKEPALLFAPNKIKPRRFRPHEWEDEKYLASWMKRPLRHFFTDTPFYPWCVPEPKVNFDLNFIK